MANGTWLLPTQIASYWVITEFFKTSTEFRLLTWPIELFCFQLRVLFTGLLPSFYKQVPSLNIKLLLTRPMQLGCYQLKVLLTGS